MSWDERDTRTHINELQYLQRKINTLSRANAESPEPSIDRTIEIMRNSQDALYNSLSRHGITPEDAYRIIMENNDRELVESVIKLQKSRDTLERKLANPKLSPKKRQFLEKSLSQKNQQYTDKWNRIKSSPNKNDLIDQIEHTIEHQLTKSRNRTKNHEPERSR
jgi:hypothetical protein